MEWIKEKVEILVGLIVTIAIIFGFVACSAAIASHHGAPEPSPCATENPC